jgi:CRP/FNR family transcriptional regulator
MDDAILKKLNNFFLLYKKQRYKKGEILIRAEDTPSGIFYISKGTVKQYSISPHGEEQILTIYKPPAFFPMMWAINGVSNTYYFEAVEDVKICLAPKDDVLVFLKKEPEVLFDLLSRLYRGMSGLLSRIEQLMFGDAYHKVIFTILNTAYRFGVKNQQTSETILRITHKEISSLSGLTKETISRESHKLQKKGLIENKNNLILIKDIKKLEEVLVGY